MRKWCQIISCTHSYLPDKTEICKLYMKDSCAEDIQGFPAKAKHRENVSLLGIWFSMAWFIMSTTSAGKIAEKAMRRRVSLIK